MLIELITHLPCRHFRPVSITDHFDESIITGTREMSGSEATRCRKRCITAAESSRPSSMFTSMICAPSSTCCRATFSAVSNSPSLISRRKRAEPGDVGALADVDEQRGRVDGAGLQTGQATGCRALRHDARRLVGHRIADRADVFRGGTAAATDDVQMPVSRPLADFLGNLLGGFVITTEGVRQAGIRVRADEAVGDRRELLDVLAQLQWPERAVQADRQRPCMAHRIPERLQRLAGECAPGGIGDGAGDADRQPQPAIVEHPVDGKDRRLRIQGIEDGLDQDDVNSAVDQCLGGLVVGGIEGIEIDVAKARIVDIGGQGCRSIGRAKHAGHEARLIGSLRRRSVGLLARQPRALPVQLTDQRFHRVVGHRHRIRIEGVGLDDVSAGGKIRRVDLADQRRLGQRQQIVVALEVLLPVGKALASKGGLVQCVTLDHGAHGTVENQHAPVELGAQALFGRRGRTIGHGSRL